jgi:hypothetical protein
MSLSQVLLVLIKMNHTQTITKPRHHQDLQATAALPQAQTTTPSTRTLLAATSEPLSNVLAYHLMQPKEKQQSSLEFMSCVPSRQTQLNTHWAYRLPSQSQVPTLQQRLRIHQGQTWSLKMPPPPPPPTVLLNQQSPQPQTSQAPLLHKKHPLSSTSPSSYHSP